MKKAILESFDRTQAILVKMMSDERLSDEIQHIAQSCIHALKTGGKILLAGNGGSAADAQHIAAEFVSRFAFDRPGLAAISLATDTSILTAVGNDYGYEQVFARQIQALSRPGDVFIAISTSGRSPNILAALHEARGRGLITVGMTGQSGGAMLELCSYCVKIPANETSKIQEGHIIVGHTLCGLVENLIFSKVDN